MSDILDSLSLEQSTILKLAEIKLIDGSIIRICDKYDVVYLNNKYFYLPFTVSNLRDIVGSEAIRPKFTILNPNNLLTRFALENQLEGALFDLIRIKESDIHSGNLLSVIVDKWKVYAIPSINQKLELSLRRLSDINPAKVPPRKYSPPDFPTVDIQ